MFSDAKKMFLDTVVTKHIFSNRKTFLLGMEIFFPLYSCLKIFFLQQNKVLVKKILREEKKMF